MWNFKITEKAYEITEMPKVKKSKFYCITFLVIVQGEVREEGAPNIDEAPS